MVGDAAYRVGDLDQARSAFSTALNHTKGSLTAQLSDTLSLAQVHVDASEPALALSVLSTAAKDQQEDQDFAARQAIIMAQGIRRHWAIWIRQKRHSESAKDLSAGVRLPDITTLALLKAAFYGRTR